MVQTRHRTEVSTQARVAPSTARRAAEVALKQAHRLAKILTDSGFESEAPMAARSMLAAGLVGAVIAPDSSRKLHALQLKVVDLVLDMFSEMLLKAQEQLPRLNQAYDGKLALFEGAAVLHVLATAEVEEVEQAVEEHTAELDAAEGALREAMAGDAAVRKALKAAEKESEASDKDLARLLEFEKVTWREALIEGTAIDAEPRRHQALVSQAMREFTRLGAEQTLVACFPNVLGRKQEERHGFDHEVVTAAEALLSEKLERAKEAAEQTKEAAAEASEQSSKAADVLNRTRERVERCQTKLQEAQSTLEVRLRAQEETDKAEGSARIEVDSHKSEVDAAAERERALEEAVAYLRELQRPDTGAEQEQNLPPEPVDEEAHQHKEQVEGEEGESGGG